MLRDVAPGIHMLTTRVFGVCRFGERHPQICIFSPDFAPAKNYVVKHLWVRATFVDFYLTTEWHFLHPNYFVHEQTFALSHAMAFWDSEYLFWVRQNGSTSSIQQDWLLPKMATRVREVGSSTNEREIPPNSARLTGTWTETRDRELLQRQNWYLYNAIGFVVLCVCLFNIRQSLRWPINMDSPSANSLSLLPRMTQELTNQVLPSCHPDLHKFRRGRRWGCKREFWFTWKFLVGSLASLHFKMLFRIVFFQHPFAITSRITFFSSFASHFFFGITALFPSSLPALHSKNVSGADFFELHGLRFIGFFESCFLRFTFTSDKNATMTPRRGLGLAMWEKMWRNWLPCFVEPVIQKSILQKTYK